MAFGEVEVLRHEADAQVHGVLRVANRGGVAIQVYGALIGLQQPVEHAYESGLAGTVLPQQGVYLAWV